MKYFMIFFIFINVIIHEIIANGVTWNVKDNEIQSKGYLWMNCDFVFIQPNLKAKTIKGISQSDKICGFELDEKSSELLVASHQSHGLLELRLLPSIDINGYKGTNFNVSVKAYDCDTLRHYSNNRRLSVVVMPQLALEFDKYEYRFQLPNYWKIKQIIGQIKVKSDRLADIVYEIYETNPIPFTIDRKTGEIYCLSSYSDYPLTNGMISFRVIATELSSHSIDTKGIVNVRITINPKCTPNLIGIPNQLDYSEIRQLNDIKRNLVVQNNQPIKLKLCNSNWPITEYKINISLAHLNNNKSISSNYTGYSQSKLLMCRIFSHSNAQLTHINTSRLRHQQVQFARVDVHKKFTLLLSLYADRLAAQSSPILCIHTEHVKKLALSLSIAQCQLTITGTNRYHPIKLPEGLCNSAWIHLALVNSLDNSGVSRFTVVVNAGSVIGSYSIDELLPQLNGQYLTFYYGSCLNGSGNDPVLLKDVVLFTDISLSFKNIKCLLDPNDYLFLMNSKTGDVEERGKYFSRAFHDISGLRDFMKRVGYINFQEQQTLGRSGPLMNDVIIEVNVIYHDNKENLVLPTSVIHVVGLDANVANGDTTIHHAQRMIDFSCADNCRITAQHSHNIALLANLRLVTVGSNNQILSDNINGFQAVTIDQCTIQVMQKDLQPGERLYLVGKQQPMSWRVISTPAIWSVQLSHSTAQSALDILRQLRLDMLEYRRTFSLICTTSQDDSTITQQLIEVSLSDQQIKYSIVHDKYVSNFIEHQAISETLRRKEYNSNYVDGYLSISKPKFAGIIIMSIMGGAACAMVITTVSCFLLSNRPGIGMLQQRYNSKTFKLASSAYPEISKNTKSTIISSIVIDPINDDDYADEDHLSMADVPITDDKTNCCQDNSAGAADSAFLCEHCTNWADFTEQRHHGNNNNNTRLQDIKRSSTINFPPLNRDLRRF